MPTLTLVKESTPVKSSLIHSASEAVAARFTVPVWTIALLLVVAVASGFAAGRRHPLHHYVSYFGYPLVMDTTTGKACYAIPPKPADPTVDPNAPVEGTDTTLARQSSMDPAIPLCGQE